MKQSITENRRWSFTKKMFFRFFFLFFVLYIFFNPNGFFPYVDNLYELYIPPFHSLIPWIAKNILHLSYDITVFTNGSGDTTYDYVIFLFLTFLSVAGSILWTIIDRTRKSYNILFYWLTVVVRYYLAFTMFSYGFVKVYKLQFPFLAPGSLLEPYGNSSPMALAWNFMGYSKGYNYFTGFGEIISGVLLLFRRTTTFGAMVSLVVAGNVMAINYCFDVPVKLLSSVLVLMSLFLLSKDIKRLLAFLIFNKIAEPSDITTPRFKKRWMNITGVVLKYTVIIFVVYENISGAIDAMQKYGDTAPKPPLYGIYNVETFTKNNDTLSPLMTDTLRWKKLVISWPGYAQVYGMNDLDKGYAFEADTIKKKITMYSYADTSKKSFLSYSMPEKDMMIIQGVWKNDSVMMWMKKFPIDSFLLVKRSFNWINEYPFNR